MTVTVTKPQYNVRDELNSLRKKTGITGEQILRAQTSTDFYNIVGNNKNLIINGAMDVWQRGTTQVKAGNGYAYVGPDHVVTYFDGTYTKTEVTLPTSETLNAMRMSLGNSASNRMNINFPIENGTRLIANKPVTLSWWDRGSKNARGMSCRVTGVGNGVFSAGYNYLSSLVQTDDISTGWKKHVVTLYPNKDLTYQHVIIEMDAQDSDWSQGDWYEITQVQLEFGTQATPFEYRHYALEQLLCQRYCYAIRQDSQSGGSAGVGIGSWGNNNNSYIIVNFPVTMRTTPAISYSGAAHFSVVAESVQWNTTSSVAITTDQQHPASVSLVFVTSAGDTRGYAARARIINASGYILFLAEI